MIVVNPDDVTVVHQRDATSVVAFQFLPMSFVIDSVIGVNLSCFH